MTAPDFIAEASVPDSGVYVLVLQRRHDAVNLRVGALGEINFCPGYYCYVGSALGKLPSRLRRHLRHEEKALHWHIDYLRPYTTVRSAVAWHTEQELECGLNRRVRHLAESSVAGFGCSDCSCGSHLHLCAQNPTDRLASLTLPGPSGDALTAQVFPTAEGSRP